MGALEITICVLGFVLLISGAANLLLFLDIRTFKKSEKRYHNAVVQFTKLANQCPRCKKILYEKLRIKRAKKVNIQSRT